MIETKKSKAKVTIVTANGIDYAVRFVPAVGPPPMPHGTWNVVEVNGVGIAWVRCNGKAYADPMLMPNYTFVAADGTKLGAEAWDRIDAVTRWLKYTQQKEET